MCKASTDDRFKWNCTKSQTIRERKVEIRWLKETGSQTTAGNQGETDTKWLNFSVVDLNPGGWMYPQQIRDFPVTRGIY